MNDHSNPRLDAIAARANDATVSEAETSLSMDGFDMDEDYPEYGQGQLMNAYMLGSKDARADVPALVAALRAVLEACDRIDASLVPHVDFEIGQKSVTATMRAVIESAFRAPFDMDRLRAAEARAKVRGKA